LAAGNLFCCTPCGNEVIGPVGFTFGNDDTAGALEGAGVGDICLGAGNFLTGLGMVVNEGFGLGATSGTDFVGIGSTTGAGAGLGTAILAGALILLAGLTGLTLS